MVSWVVLRLAGAVLMLCASVPGVVWAHADLEIQIAAVTERIAQDPDDASLYLRRGELHREHRDWKAAEADYRRARERDPDLTAVDLCDGRMKLEAGRAKAAKRAIDRFLVREPGHSQGLAIRARALVELGRPLEAAADYTEAIAHLPPSNRGHPEYYLERARALASAGSEHTEEAIRGLDEGLRQLGEPVTLQLLALELELEIGRFDAALGRLDRMASGAARKESFLLRRAEILERAGRLEDARASYADVLSAIESLPSSRRGTRAVRRLEDQAEGAIARLSGRTGEDEGQPTN